MMACFAGHLDKLLDQEVAWNHFAVSQHSIVSGLH